ncbi:MAG: type I 3-dehydroquinate dehydratase [Thermoanaerobaculia bacterium]
MAESALLVGSLTSPPSSVPVESESIWALEWRADLLGEPSPSDRLDEQRSIYTLRSRKEGGRSDDLAGDRSRRLVGAASVHDLVDLEAERDLTAEVLAGVPRDQRIISWHGPAESLGELRRRFEAMAETPARWYKLVPAATRPREAVEPLALLRTLGRDDVIAFASGEAGAWSRLLAPRLGAPVVYAQSQPEPAAPGQLSVENLVTDYGLPDLPAVSNLCGIVGRPVHHSLSPRLHNLMYRKLAMDWLYVPFHVPIFGDFWIDVVERGSLEVLGFDFKALSVTAPFKEIAMAVAGAVSPLAEHIAAANSLARRGEVWEAECTDTEGVTAPLRSRGIVMAGSRAAVVGAGGAGRAALYALSMEGAVVTLANRSPNRGRRVALELGVDFTPLEELQPESYDVVVNATPLGVSGSELPFNLDRMRPEAVVVDLAYRRGGATSLVEAVRASGRTAIDGREVLLYQAVPQFLWMTGQSLDVEAGRSALGLPRAGGPAA